jgi:predicted TIM-barrel fold metal-dependent hydrolase
MANPAAPDCVARVIAALDGGWLQGVCLFPAMHRYPMADPRVRPVLEAAAAHPGAIVFVHCGVLTVGVRRKLGLPSLFDMRYSNPIDLHAIAMEFPRVNFVIPHFGAGYFREALMLCDLCPNVYLDTSSSNSWVRYQPEKLDLPAVFRKALEVAGPRRLLFGSDSSFFPRGWHSQVFQSQIQALCDIEISPDHASLILGGNLQRLLAR